MNWNDMHIQYPSDNAKIKRLPCLAMAIGLFLIGNLSCDQGTEPELDKTCEAPDEDCLCADDSDCVITPFYQNATTEQDCAYYCGCRPGLPRNQAAAERNEQHYWEIGCTDHEADCDTCMPPHYRFWPECRKNRCVSMKEQTD